MIRQKTEAELAADKAAFDALPLIEQIRIVVREELARERGHEVQRQGYNQSAPQWPYSDQYGRKWPS